MTTASLFKRLFALGIDIIVFSVGFAIIYLATPVEYETFFGESGKGSLIGVSVPTSFPYIPFILSWIPFMIITEFRHGQSIGKRLIKIKVVRLDMTVPSAQQILIRHLFDPIDFIFAIGLFVALTSRNRRRIGDHVAGTFVVRK